MKKFVTSLCLLFLIPVICAVAGCNTLSEGDGWKEVQSITYTTDKGTTTLTSQCVWDTTSEYIDQSEYDEVTNEQKISVYEIPRTQNISIDRKEFKNSANYIVGKVYYCSYYGYMKITVNSYKLNFIKVKITSDKVIEIDYNNEVKQISTISYEITYFKN